MHELVTIVETIETVPVVEPIINVFEFINDSKKMALLIRANEALHINKNLNKKLIFVYCCPKVGSTSIISSLRIFGIDKFSILHIHDEEMLKVLSRINGITINEIILYNKYLGRDIYVIDVYRSPIEQKISAYFEKIGVYHFNTTDENVNTYNLQKVITRFNKIFPYLANGNHFIDKYNINIPDHFSVKDKHLLINQHNINYISLRLKDSTNWGAILTQILGTKICIIKDYESKDKAIKKLYLAFKSTYKIPKNLLNEIMKCKYLNYYYSLDEINAYFLSWNKLSTSDFIPYTEEQYKMYEDLSIENSHLDYIQLNHYMDEGCVCKICTNKRQFIASCLTKGQIVTDRIQHTDVKNELISKRIAKVTQLNKIMISMPKKGKDFKREMSNIVKGGSIFN